MEASPLTHRHDEDDLRRMGRSQLLERNFGTVMLLPFAIVNMGTWLAMLQQTEFPLIDGGRAGMVWGFVVTWILATMLAASLAEMVSMAPSSGGQLHWVSEFAHESVQKPLSYLSGWLDTLAWQGYFAFGAYAGGETILILASIYDPTYTPTAWQGTLATIAMCVFTVLINIFGLKLLAAFEVFAMVAFSVAFIALLVALWVLSPTVSAKEAFESTADFGGWGSIGAAVLIGQLGAGSALLGADGPGHMAEEIQDATITVPRTIMVAFFINGVTGLAITITFAFIVQNVQEQIVDSTSAFPFIQVFVDAMGRPVAVGLISLSVVVTFCASVGCLTTASRQAWSFAHHGGFVFPSVFGKVSSVRGARVPVYAICASSTLAGVFALLNLGGSEVFNSISGMTTGSMLMSYALSIGSVLWRRLSGRPLPPARWSLGRFGIVINAISMAYISQLIVISFFPLFSDPTPVAMNWGIAVFAGVLLLAAVNYFIFGAKGYQSPVELVKAQDSEAQDEPEIEHPKTG